MLSLLLCTLISDTPVSVSPPIATGAEIESWSVLLRVGTPTPNPVPPGPAPVPPPPGPVPPSPPEPTPTPPDEPVSFPDEKYGLSTAAYRAALVVVPESSRAFSPQLADVFESTAAAIVAGTLRGQKIVDHLTVERTRVLGACEGDWMECSKALADRLEKLLGEGKIRSYADMAVALREISTGLRAVK